MHQRGRYMPQKKTGHYRFPIEVQFFKRGDIKRVMFTNLWSPITMGSFTVHANALSYWNAQRTNELEVPMLVIHYVDLESITLILFWDLKKRAFFATNFFFRSYLLENLNQMSRFSNRGRPLTRYSASLNIRTKECFPSHTRPRWLLGSSS